MMEPDRRKILDRQPSPPSDLAPKSRRGLAGALLVIACLYGMCRLPNWDVSATNGLSAQDQLEMLSSPVTSEEKRRAVVQRTQVEILDRVRVLHAVAAEDSPAGLDARRALDNIGEALGD